MNEEINSIPGLLAYYNKCTEEVRGYLPHITKLVENFPLDVCLTYVFARLELGQNMALYCGAVKLHKTNAEVTRGVVSTHHMTRTSFLTLYETVFGIELPGKAQKMLEVAENTRDRVMHGKTTTNQNLRNAIARVLEYAEAVNTQLHAKHSIKPFGTLTGFAGRAKKLDKRTSRFVLKGMGFAIS